MKKYGSILALIFLLAIGCKKNSSTSKNSSAGSPASPSSTATTTNDSATATAALVGTWYLDSIVAYSGGQPVSVTSVTVGVNDWHYDKSLALYNNNPNSPYQCLAAHSGMAPISVPWYVSKSDFQYTGLLYLQSYAYITGYIRTLTSTKLITSDGTGNVKQGWYYYLHK